MELTELVILQGLVNREEYARKVVPFIKKEYFSDQKDQEVYTMIYNHIDKYNGLPTPTSLL